MLFIGLSLSVVLILVGLGLFMWFNGNTYDPIPADLVEIITGISHSVAGEPSIASYTNALDVYGYTNVVVSSDPQPLSPGLIHITPYSDGTFRKIEVHTHKDAITLYSSVPRST